MKIRIGILGYGNLGRGIEAAISHNADMELQSFMMGESENIHDVMIAMEEATIALELTTQVRNKLVDSYQELKNMQI